MQEYSKGCKVDPSDIGLTIRFFIVSSSVTSDRIMVAQRDEMKPSPALWGEGDGPHHQTIHPRRKARIAVVHEKVKQNNEALLSSVLRGMLLGGYK